MKRFCALALALCLLPLSGCGGIYANYREIAQLQIIETLGFDAEAGRVRLSVSTGDSVSSGGGSGEGEGGNKATRMTAAADSIHLAAARLQDYSTSEELYYAHSRYLLLGESAACDAARYLDYVERSVQTRLDVPLLVVHGSSAKELVMEVGGEESDVTQALTSLERDALRRGDARFFTCGEIAAALANQGAALCVALRAEKTKSVDGRDSITPLPDGFAILKDGALVGWIDSENGQGVTLMLGALNAGAVVLPGGVTVEFSRSKAEFSPVWGEDGELARLDVDLSIAASVLETNSTLDLSDDAVLSLLGTLLARKATGWVETVLRKSVELGADFMGLGHKLALAAPGRWDELKPRWPELLETLEIRVSCEAEILRGYDITDPLNVRGRD